MLNEDVSEQNTQTCLTPRSQADHQLRGIRMNKRDAVKIKRKLVEHNALVGEVKQAAIL